MLSLEELKIQIENLMNNKKYEAVIDLLSDAMILTHPTLLETKGRAYFELGIGCNITARFKEAIEAFSAALKIAPTSAIYLNGLGIAYAGIKEYSAAIPAFNKAIKSDNTLASPYNGLGNIYSDLFLYEDAIEAYNDAIKRDSKYVKAYNGLGNVYFDLEQYDKAIDVFNNGVEVDPKYQNLYNGLGNAHKGKKNTNEAIKFYNEAININPSYDPPHYNIASVYYDLKKYKDAKESFQRYIDLTKEQPDIYTKRAKEKVDELTKILDNIDYQNINELIDKIKSVLLHKDGNVTHYTGFSITQELLLNKSAFRLSEGAFLNDTTEGRELFDFIDFHTATSQQSKDTEAKPFAQRPFIGSFVAEKNHDNLTLWRTYGKENNEEARGCAITIDAQELLESIKRKLAPNSDNDSPTNDSEDLRFYRVAYQTREGHFIIPDATDDEKELNDQMQELKKSIAAFQENVKDKTDKDTRVKDVLELLNSIAYLFKSAEYQYEFELRLVVKKGIGFEKKILTDRNRLKVYIDLVDITPLIRKITFGPKVEKRDEWAAIFYYKLEKDNHFPDIYISHLPFK